MRCYIWFLHTLLTQNDNNRLFFMLQNILTFWLNQVDLNWQQKIQLKSTWYHTKGFYFIHFISFYFFSIFCIPFYIFIIFLIYQFFFIYFFISLFHIFIPFFIFLFLSYIFYPFFYSSLIFSSLICFTFFTYFSSNTKTSQPILECLYLDFITVGSPFFSFFI